MGVNKLKRLPSGISDYEKLITNDYYYIDKTEYVEKLENYPNPNIMFLRPRKFGKTLFTSTLENYYDIKKQDKFDILFGETYIGKNPTKLKNSYHVLKFNFSGINTETIESTMSGFKREVASSIDLFVKKYNLDFFVNMDSEAEDILDNLIKAFSFQKAGEKIFVIIDEYDHFANELLGFNVEGFRGLISKNGRVRKWYEILKKGTESVVDRIFITGVAPITLDSMTSGFNISTDITRDFRFNEMMGFTKEELEEMMNNQGISSKEQEKLFPVMKLNYDGYKFSIKAEKRVYNSNMTLYFLNEYMSLGELPREMVDVNIASDYTKVGNMLNLCKSEKKLEILQKTIAGEVIISNITQKFNPEIGFGDKEMISMLYYLGYLTVKEEELGSEKLVIPNLVMRNIYSDYFINIINEWADLTDDIDYTEIKKEIACEGKITQIVNLLEKYLQNLSNRDFQKFDEKYVKLIFYCLAMNMQNLFFIKSELEIQRKYPDILIIPKESEKGYNSVMIEFKYLKKGEEGLLSLKQEEAKKQIQEYAEFDEMKIINKLNKYTVIAVVDKVYIEKI